MTPVNQNVTCHDVSSLNILAFPEIEQLPIRSKVISYKKGIMIAKSNNTIQPSHVDAASVQVLLETEVCQSTRKTS